VIDKDLFKKEHINVKIGNRFGDYDQVIDEFFFKKVKKLKGEISSSDGSEYKLISNNGDKFVIDFILAEREFECLNEKIASFESVTIRCYGKVKELDGEDYLSIDDIDVINETNYDLE